MTSRLNDAAGAVAVGSDGIFGRFAARERGVGVMDGVGDAGSRIGFCAAGLHAVKNKRTRKIKRYGFIGGFLSIITTLPLSSLFRHMFENEKNPSWGGVLSTNISEVIGEPTVRKLQKP
jgi:hypothetical protein